jgi:son of sevenless-like protein
MVDQQKPEIVRCPEPFEPLFVEAEKIMGSFFNHLNRNPKEGRIDIQGVRYILVRAESMALELHEELRKTFGKVGAGHITYKLGRACGMRDAKAFHARHNVEDPTMKLALGPTHFAHTGWAFVDIFPESTPTMDDDYFLCYDHPYSFEAESYIEGKIATSQPVCHMSAGYSSGWCEVSFGVELKAEELTCRAKGDDQCIFAMATPKRFDEKVQAFKKKRGLK